MADPDPLTDRQRALANNAVSTTLNAAGHWVDVETSNAIVSAVLTALATDDISEQAATHFCGNCDGIDPTTCLMNPDPAVQKHLEQLRTECAAQPAEEDEPQ
ncbi:hypothetical protein [Streptomyces sp. NPDC056169]|uniref:hypothetical protein n=1 Tax=Streptomyces sp. NPDC056169 TaxID=3345734 RepID=UPI0035DB2957